jgi:hypothetical protein
MIKARIVSRRARFVQEPLFRLSNRVSMASASSAGLDQQERLCVQWVQPQPRTRLMRVIRYKVLVVGENHCGKTSIIKRCVLKCCAPDPLAAC